MGLFNSENLVLLIKAAGYLGIFGIVFAESGLFFGFFLPGDSLLFTAGFLASQHYLNIYLLVPLIFLGALLGDNVGYFIGNKMGKKVFHKPDSRFFKQEYRERAEEFYKKHGSKTIILARFIPFIRTFAPLLAGVGKMNYKKFLFFDILGSLFWSASITLMGFFLGNIIPNVDHYILPIILGIIIISLSPSLVFAARQQLLKYFKKKRSKISKA